MTRRILITGSNGYVGHAVVHELERDPENQLVLLNRRPPANSPHRVIAADLTKAEQVESALDQLDVDAFCHLAALTLARESVTHPLPYWRTNVTGTINLLTGLPAGTPVVMTSTAAVYTGDAEGALDEDTPTKPANPYGASKLAAEHVLSSWAAATESPVTILRCFTIAGAVNGVADTEPTRIIPAMLQALRGEGPAFTINGDGSTVRDYTHVADVAAAISLALVSPQTGTYNVGTGEGISIAQLVETAQEVTGRHLTITRSEPKQEARRLVANSDRLRQHLEWVPFRSNAKRLLTDAWDASG